MGRGISSHFARVRTRADDGPGGVDDHCSDGYVCVQRSRTRLFEGEPHPRLIRREHRCAGSAERRIDERLVLLAEPEPRGHRPDLLVGIEVEVLAQHRELHRRQSEVGEDLEVPSRRHLVELLALRLVEAKMVDHGGCERPILGARHVGEQQAYVVAEHPRGNEEILRDRHEPECPAFARLLAQRVQERRQLIAQPGLHGLYLPEAVLAHSDHGKVHAGVVHERIVADTAPRRQAEQIVGRGASLSPMRTLVVDHPLVAHKLTTLRDERTDSPTFRRLADELVTLLAYEATREVRTEPVEVMTPVAAATGVRLAQPKPLVVPILRAGLGMLEGMQRLLPTAEVGFLGMVRDEETLMASTYANRIPEDLTGRQCYVLDPMLATGGTLVAAVRLLLDRGAMDITAICLLAAPEGIAYVEEDLGAQAPVRLVTAGLDEKLNEHGYIVPGLGDAGDRLYGLV